MKHIEPPAECWVHSDVEVRDSAIEGRGLFATRNIAEGVVVMRLGGTIVSDAELDDLIAEADAGRRPYVDSTKIVEDVNLFIPPGPVHFGNHSCDPTMWHTDAFTLVARRDVGAGEELTMDYATQTEGDFHMDCNCGSALCRGVVTGTDWRQPELRSRYGRHWVPAVLHKLDDD